MVCGCRSPFNTQDLNNKLGTMHVSVVLRLTNEIVSRIRRQFERNHQNLRIVEKDKNKLGQTANAWCTRVMGNRAAMMDAIYVQNKAQVTNQLHVLPKQSPKMRIINVARM